MENHVLRSLSMERGRSEQVVQYGRTGLQVQRAVPPDFQWILQYLYYLCIHIQWREMLSFPGNGDYLLNTHVVLLMQNDEVMHGNNTSMQ